MVKDDPGYESRHESARAERGERIPYEVSGDLYRWALAPGLFEVRLDSAVVRQLSSDLKAMGRLRGSREELGGILFGAGTVSPGGHALGVHSVETYCSTGLHQIIGIRKERVVPGSPPANKFGSDPVQPVGYYWIASEGHTGLTQRDATLMNERFCEPQDICIAIQAWEEGRAAATFFYWRDRRLESVPAEFPALLDSPIPQPPASPEPIARYLPAEVRTTRGYRKAAVGCVAIAGLALAAWTISHNRDVAGTAGARSASASFGLTASQQEGGVLLTWNARSVEIVNAAEGLLSVTDGQSQTNTRLEAAQLAAGSYWYFPLSEKVQFRLDILRADGRWSKDSATVTLPKRQLDPAPPGASAAVIPPQNSHELMRPRLPANLPAAPTPPPVRSSEMPVAASPEVSTPQQQQTPSPPPAKQPAPREQVQLPEPLPANDRAPAIPEASPIPQRTAPAAAPPPDTVAAVSLPVASEKAASPVTPPIPVRQPKPIVPANLERMLTRPIAIRVTMTVDDTGKVVNAQATGVEGPLASSLGNIAAATARLWKFKPALRDNRPVSAVVEVEFKFGTAR